jgi:hypothetical protein
MINFILISIAVFVFVVICILIFMSIMNTSKIEKFELESPKMQLVQYPQTKPISISGRTSSTAFSGYLKQTFISNNKTYTIDYSSYYADIYLPMLLFDYNTNPEKAGGHFGLYLYNTSNGIYTGTKIFPLLPNIDENKGDWISINLPNTTVIKRYGFIARKDLECRAPGSWKLFGYNKSSNNPTLIDEQVERIKGSDYYNNDYMYVKNILNNNNVFDSYTFVFKKTADSSKNSQHGYMINFTQILLFGDS